MVYYDEFGNEYNNVEEFIGDSYLKWVHNKFIINNKVVFIQTPTGSGKSYFVYKDLLAYAVEHGERILYLVNRKILKEQLQKEAAIALNDIKIKRNRYDTNSYIVMETYQYLEKNMEDKGQEWGMCYLAQFNYIIMDEAHYFLQDSTYNTSNYWSFYAIRGSYRAVRIFMSATIDEVKTFYANTYKEYIEMCNWEYNDAMKPIEYQLHLNYDYIKPHIFDSYEEMAKFIIEEDKYSKWFIIVDSKDRGRGLENTIKKMVREKNARIKERNKDDKMEEIICDTVFIDAEYESSPEAVKSVTEVVMENAMRAKVVIATIVLDNGVSIKDEALRNLVVVTDSKSELLQIIGRKRMTEGETVDLFLYKGKREEFERRLRKVEECIKVAEEIEQNHRKFGTTINLVLPKMLHSERYYELCKKVIVYNKFNKDLFVNPLSKMQLLYMEKNYKEILESFDLDEEFGFFNLQMKWLGIEADDVKNKYLVDVQETLRQKVITALDALVGKEFDREAAIEQKNTYRNELYDLFKRYCIDNLEDSKENQRILDTLYKSSDAITEDKFNIVMTALKLPYQMEVRREGKKYYTIRKITIVEN